MTKTRSTKRALLVSLLALLTCVSMLVGTTFAWFTDSVTSAGNIIQSGTLDVTMEWTDGTKAVPAADSDAWTDASTGAIFNYSLWEPGYTEVRHIKIANEGTLALTYQLNIIPTGEVTKLAEVIDVYYIDPAVQVADRTGLTDANKLGTLKDVLAQISTSASGDLLAGENDTVTLALKMQETAGNEYQDLSIGSSFAIQLLATQLAYEKDSFGDQYDKDAARDSNITVATEKDIQDAFADAQDGDVITLANDIDVEDGLIFATDANVTFDLGGFALKGNTDVLLDVTAGNVVLQNGTIENKNTNPITRAVTADTLVSLKLSGDAVAEIKDVKIETNGVGILLEDNAKVTELNAVVKSYVNANGSCDGTAISLLDNARIEKISGGEYISTYTEEFINAYTGSFSGNAIYALSINSANASVGEISGGTFLGRADDGRNGATIFVNAGKLEKISGGYFGYCRYTMRNTPYFLITVNTANGASLGAITGGTFEYASGFGCDFANIVEQSGSKIEKTDEKVTITIKFSSSVKTQNVAVWKVVPN